MLTSNCWRQAMGNLFGIGRVFFGLAMAEMGLHTIYYRDFPYMLVPAEHPWIAGPGVLVYLSGTLLLVAGVSIVFKIRIRQVSILLGAVLLLIFIFYFIPYQFLSGANYLSFGEWENSEKELALASGAFIIAGCFSAENENSVSRRLARIIPLGGVLFSITMISFGIDHFIYAEPASTLVPAWIPGALFWTYFAGVALIAAGAAIILKINVRLIAALLGTMIFSWVIIIHVARVLYAPADELGGEVTSAFLALAYSGIAFVLAGAPENKTAQKKT